MAAPSEPIDLVAHGLVKGMPAAWLAGKETDLLAPAAPPRARNAARDGAAESSTAARSPQD